MDWHHFHWNIPALNTARGVSVGETIMGERRSDRLGMKGGRVLCGEPMVGYVPITDRCNEIRPFAKSKKDSEVKIKLRCFCFFLFLFFQVLVFYMPVSG